MKVRTEIKQTFFDLAVSYAGSAEAAYDIAYAAGCSVTDTPPAVVEIPDVQNAAVAAYFVQQQVTPATKADDTEINGLL